MSKFLTRFCPGLNKHFKKEHVYMNVHSKVSETLPPQHKLFPDCYTVRQKARSFTVPFFRTVILSLQRDDTTNQTHKGKHILCT